MTTIITGKLATGGRLGEGWLLVERDRIADTGFGRPPGKPDLVHPGVICAGLCDLQVNGAAGQQVIDGPDALEKIDQAALRHGITSYLATVISTDPGTASRAVRQIAERSGDPSSPLEGAHLEGPFLSHEFRGVHREEWLRAPAGGIPDYYSDPAVKLVTLAPEGDGALDLIEQLTARQVTVSMGHSGATLADAQRAVEHGARAVTHLFNAMARFGHREPGLVGFALDSDAVAVGVIADGDHLAPLTLRLVRKAAGERVILVTDASPAAGLSAPGRFELAGIAMERTESGRAQTLDGHLAGSAIMLDDAVRHYAESTGAPLAEALEAASERPAALVGLNSGLRPGAYADVVLLDDSGNVEQTMRRGAWVHRAESATRSV